MVSAWIKHVKQYAKTHKIKFGEAMHAAKKTWKRGGQEGGQQTATGDNDDSSTVPAEMGGSHKSDGMSGPSEMGSSHKSDDMPGAADTDKSTAASVGGRRRRRTAKVQGGRRRKGGKSRRHKGGQLYGFTGGPYTGSELPDGAGRFQPQPNTTWKNDSSELLKR